VRSAYLAEGYWRRPDVTAGVFRPSPTGHGDRVFLMGNLGRQHPDGCLEHLGRTDFQVQIRGYRVELAEVERALMAIEGVREAVVVAQPGPSGEIRLIAYVVPSVRSALAAGAIRQALRATLPDHMVPAHLVLLDTMPLNATSKVDRTALPRPGRTRPELETSFEAPRTPIEEMLSRIWTEVLGLDRVGVHDGFLELGGDSLLAARVVSRVLDALDVDVPVRALLESPTVAAMAMVVIARRIEIEMARPDAEPGPTTGLA
jgi:acyl carrier protein